MNLVPTEPPPSSRSPALFACLVVALLFGCDATTTVEPSGGGTGGTGGFDAGSGGGGAAPCTCRPGPHQNLIYALSDEGEVWGYDPVGE